ncbi:MAG: hypothetical protein E6H06_19970 [Bacteroidetes bacterium]|nr:MAG: hypothetical protein E6H06_19970 [Bacteroidota bacterium]
MSQFISLQEAIAMTTRYRDDKVKILTDQFAGKDILPTCETFDRETFDKILSLADCQKIRLYFSMDSSLKIRMIIAGVNSKDEDILPAAAADDGGSIGEQGQLCPPICPPSSPLNP